MYSVTGDASSLVGDINKSIRRLAIDWLNKHVIDKLTEARNLLKEHETGASVSGQISTVISNSLCGKHASCVCVCVRASLSLSLSLSISVCV